MRSTSFAARLAAYVKSPGTPQRSADVVARCPRQRHSSFPRFPSMGYSSSPQISQRKGEARELAQDASELEDSQKADAAGNTVEIKDGKPESDLPHFRGKQQQRISIIHGETEDPFPDPATIIPKKPPQIGEESLPHPIWTREELTSVVIAHKPPKNVVDWLAYISVQFLRRSFDLMSGYTFGTLNEANWLRRLIYLENIAGVPGMMGAMARHLKSLRSMRRDNGWIHTLMEEAENERMHLMVVLQLKQPGKLFRFGVVVSQGFYVSIFFLLYLISPRYCHRFVGYLEEEAVKTYTRLLNDIDAGLIPEWKNKPASDIAVQYWKLPEGSTLRDVFSAIRADEAHHRLVNHTLGSMQPNQHNPFKAGH